MSGSIRRLAGQARVPSMRAAEQASRAGAEALRQVLAQSAARSAEASAIGRLVGRVEPVAASRFRNPWGIALPDEWLAVMPRLGMPPSEVAAGLIPHLLRMHPGLRLIDVLLLFRELSEQMQGGGTASRPSSPAGGGGGSVLRMDPRWVLSAGVPGGDIFANGGFAPAYPASGITHSPEVFQGWYEGGLFLNASAYENAFAGPGPVEGSEIWTTYASYYWTGGSTTPEEAQDLRPFYEPAPGGGAQGAQSPLSGLSRLSRARDALGALGLPGTVPATRGLHPAWMDRVHEAREELGLREVEVPARRVRFRSGRQAEFVPVDWVGAFAMDSVEVSPEGVRPAPPHRWSPPGPGVRETKIKITKAYLAAAAAINAVTETGDFMEQLWKALPKADRTARRTATGNLRYDAMMRDLYRGWSRIDWPEALINLHVNNLEDQIYGGMGALATAAGLAIRRGGGQGGIGTGNALDGGTGAGYGSGRATEEQGAGRGANPIADVLDWYSNRLKSAIRRERSR